MVTLDSSSPALAESRPPRGRTGRRQAFTILVAALWSTASGLEAQSVFSVDATVELRSGGLRFPDGSLQTAATANYPAPVERTGRTQCFAANGDPRSCAGTGEDGEHQAGAAWPIQRFVDNGDGTILDRLTGLVWLKDANCLGATADWQQALTWVVVTLNFSPGTDCTDYAPRTYRDWRLPNVKELLSLADYSRSAPALPEGHLFAKLPSLSVAYWSSSTFASFGTGAWGVDLNTGLSQSFSKSSSQRVLAVRGGIP